MQVLLLRYDDLAILGLKNALCGAALAICAWVRSRASDFALTASETSGTKVSGEIDFGSREAHATWSFLALEPAWSVDSGVFDNVIWFDTMTRCRKCKEKVRTG
jgi:hypothetical protein